MNKHATGKHSVSLTTNRIGVGDGKKLCVIVISLCVVICLLAVAIMVVYFGSKIYAKEEYAILSESVRFSPNPTDEPDISPMTMVDDEAAAEPIHIPVDFPYLQSLNADVDGWIYIEGTDIDYPVLYDSSGKDYYLEHTLTEAYSPSGSIFVQNLNNRGFVDFNTVLYGHNMRDGSMFAQLHQFEIREFFDNHDTIILYTIDRVLTYRVFAAYVSSADNILVSYSFASDEDCRNYLEDIFVHDGNFRSDIDLLPDDRIITLSTCTGWTSTRLVVQGVLISEVAGVCMTEE